MPLPSTTTTPVQCHPALAPANELHIVIELISQLYTNNTGQFPVCSHSRNQYVMVAYRIDTNAILGMPFPSWADHHHLPAYNSITTRLADRGHLVNLQILDKEVSAEYKQTIKTRWKAYFQLVPPNVHCQNQTKLAIQTFKDHFIAILAGINKIHLKSLWDLLLPQAKITIYLLQQSTLLPAMSAWEHFNRLLNFDATPLGPLGCRVLYHAKAAVPHSWEFCGNNGFYIGPVMDHYLCFTIINATSCAFLISDLVAFRHDFLQHLTPTPSNWLIHRLPFLSDALQDAPNISCNGQLNAIADLCDLFSSWQNQALPTKTSTRDTSSYGTSPSRDRPHMMRTLPSIRPPSTPTTEPTSASLVAPADQANPPPRVEINTDSNWTMVPTRPLTRSVMCLPKPIA